MERLEVIERDSPVNASIARILDVVAGSAARTSPMWHRERMGGNEAGESRRQLKQVHPWKKCG